MRFPISSWLINSHDLDAGRTAGYPGAPPGLRKNPSGVSATRPVLGLVLTCMLGLASAQAPSRADADNAHDKLQLVSATGARPRDERTESVRTAFTDREINAYLKYYGPTFLPDGLTDPEIALGDPGRVAVRGLVDLDAVRTSRQRDWLDPLSYMGGLVDFTANGVVIASNGRGMAVFESATLAGVAVPKTIVKELVRYFTVTPESPSGLDIDAPIDLPAQIESIFFEPGRATVVQ